MSEIITGATVALASIWFKDYIDTKNTSKSTIKQKAIEAYTLTWRLIDSMFPQQVLCLNLLKDKDILTHATISRQSPDTSLEDLKKLEVLITENFTALRLEQLKITEFTAARIDYLTNIVINYQNTEIKEPEFKDKIKDLNNNLLAACIILRNRLSDEYINKENPPKNLFYYL